MHAVAAAVYYRRDGGVPPCSNVNKFLPIATGNARRPPGDEAIIMRGDIANW